MTLLTISAATPTGKHDAGQLPTQPQPMTCDSSGEVR